MKTSSYPAFYTFELDEWTVRFVALPKVRRDYYTRTAPPGWHPVRWYEISQKWDDTSEIQREINMQRVREVAAKWFFGGGHRRTHGGGNLELA